MISTQKNLKISKIDFDMGQNEYEDLLKEDFKSIDKNYHNQIIYRRGSLK